MTAPVSTPVRQSGAPWVHRLGGRRSRPHGRHQRSACTTSACGVSGRVAVRIGRAEDGDDRRVDRRGQVSWASVAGDQDRQPRQHRCQLEERHLADDVDQRDLGRKCPPDAVRLLHGRPRRQAGRWWRRRPPQVSAASRGEALRRPFLDQTSGARVDTDQWSVAVVSGQEVCRRLMCRTRNPQRDAVP